MGRIHLDQSALSSSSFMKSSFLIQMIRWIRCSSRIEFFIFLIGWGSSLNGESFDIQLLPSSSSLLISRAESNHLLLAYIHMKESHDPGRPFKVAITTSAFFTSSFTASSCSLIWETLVKYDCMVSAFWIFTFFNWFLKVIFCLCSSLQIAWSRNQIAL